MQTPQLCQCNVQGVLLHFHSSTAEMSTLANCLSQFNDIHSFQWGTFCALDHQVW